MQSVLAYGAIGDGVTDDSIAFQLALSSAKNIFVPYTQNGYKITSTLTLLDNMSINGETGSKLLHYSNSNLIDVRGTSITVQNLTIDGQHATGSDIVLRTDITDTTNVNINNIYGIASKGLITDVGSSHINYKINIRDIKHFPACGRTILLSKVSQGEINGVLVDYTNSTSPDFAAIEIAATDGIQGGLLITNIDLKGSDSQSYPNQHGIVFGTNEHVTISNANILFMGGYGIWSVNSINFRLENLNISFCTNDQIFINTGGYSTISNVMVRGRANGALSFLITSTYGINLITCGNITITGSDIKSCGSGVWIDNSQYITITGCNITTHTFWGIISTNAAASGLTVGCQFLGNSSGDVFQTGASQFAASCLKQNGTLGSLSGAGSM